MHTSEGSRDNKNFREGDGGIATQKRYVPSYTKECMTRHKNIDIRDDGTTFLDIHPRLKSKYALSHSKYKLPFTAEVTTTRIALRAIIVGPYTCTHTIKTEKANLVESLA